MELIITDWKPGLKKISLTKLLKKCGLTLKQSREAVNDLLDGKAIHINKLTPTQAKSIVAEAIFCNAICVVKEE